MSGVKVAAAKIERVREGKRQAEDDLLAVEEPLEIRLGFGLGDSREQRSLSVTMRTPGHDFELVLGFLFTEGIISDIKDVSGIHYCANVEKPEERENVVRVELVPGHPLDWEKLERHFYTSSSCGVCGKSSIDSVRSQCPVIPKGIPVFDAQLIHQLPDLLRQEQNVFEYTGGLHAAALFDVNGKLIMLREDVGRHNAVDKVIGAALLKNLIPLNEYVIQVSGRASFELIQKALMAGIPILSAVGAPSSLAVDLARENGMTVLGFVRDNRFNIYSGEERIEA